MRADQRLRAFEIIAGGSDRGSDAQASLSILGRVRVFQLFLDVFDGDETLQVVLIVDDQQLLDAMPVQDRSAASSVVPTGTVIRFSFVITSEIGQVETRFKAQVAIGENTYQLAVSW